MDSNEYATNALALLGLAALTLGTLAMIYRAIRQWLINRQTTAGDVAAQLVADVKRGEGFTFHKPVMSSDSRIPPSDRSVADRLPATSTNGGQGIATPGNAGNAALPGNALPEAARDIVRFQARVEAVIAIVESGKVGQVEAIERIFGCKRSGRAESVYARARAAVEAQIQPAPVEYVGDMVKRVQSEVAGESR